MSLSSSSRFELARKWRFTWEAQSHIPTLRLLLFKSNTTPSVHCQNLQIQLNLSQSTLAVSWFQVQHNKQISLSIPIPRVLVDAESPVNFRALDDYIEVKLVLLLPVNHPILSSFDSVLNSQQDAENLSFLDTSKPLVMDSGIKEISVEQNTRILNFGIQMSHGCVNMIGLLESVLLRQINAIESVHLYHLLMQVRRLQSLHIRTCVSFLYASMVFDTDIKSLSSSGGVNFCCRKCSFKLTSSPLRNFVEMPSIEWREVADNWFGACCCSFGGISEKLVTKYANSYKCEQGVCLLSSTSVTLSKDDLVEFCLPEKGSLLNSSSSLCTHGGESYCETMGESGIKHEETIIYGNPSHDDSRNTAFYENGCAKCNHGDVEEETYQGCQFSMESEYLVRECHSESYAQIVDDCCNLDLSRTFEKEQTANTVTNFTANQKSFLNGFLGNIFMVRSSNISEEIKWLEFMCPQCSSVLGAYPCFQGHEPVDGGIRLFKCYISTSLAVGESEDLFRKYTLERMFASQLMEIANSELSFRTVVKDLKTKAPVLHVVLINSDSWSYSSTCHRIQDSENSVPKTELHPVIKVLYSEDIERLSAEWARKNSVDEIFMLSCQIKELMNPLISGRDTYPPSYASLQDMLLSSLHR